MKESPFQIRPFANLNSLQSLGIISACLLAFSLPFEMSQPLIVIGAFRLTNLELLLFLTIFFAILLIFLERRWQQPGWIKVPARWLVLLGFFALVLAVSALLAPEFKLNALKAALRTLIGLALALLLTQLFQEKSQLRYLFGALLAGGLLSVGLGLAEVWSHQTFEFLNLFRLQPTLAGPFVRLSGSFNHANQTAMFIEATLPFLLVVTWKLGRNKNWLAALAGIVIIALYLQAAFLTYSRSSFVTIFISLLIVAAALWFWHRERRRLAIFWSSIAGLVLLLGIFNTLISPVLLLRLSSEGDNEWYNLYFAVPEHLEMEAGEVQPVTVSVTNEGSLIWSGQSEEPVNLGGRWYRLSDDARSDTEVRWPLDEDVPPGDTLQMTVFLEAPSETGEYEFEWDMVQEGVVWFSIRNGMHFTSSVTVIPASGNVVTAGEWDDFHSARPNVQPIPNRRVLWSIAARQLFQRPLIGIGLDNFRLTYGQVMGWQAWNTSIHTNNWYVETAVSVGLLGAVPFFGWLALLGLDLFNHIRSRRINLWQVALICALIAYAVHGLLDYFLLFNGTGLLFWILVGMWMVLAWPEESV